MQWSTHGISQTVLNASRVHCRSQNHPQHGGRLARYPAHSQACHCEPAPGLLLGGQRGAQQHVTSFRARRLAAAKVRKEGILRARARVASHGACLRRRRRASIKPLLPASTIPLHASPAGARPGVCQPWRDKRAGAPPVLLQVLSPAVHQGTRARFTIRRGERHLSLVGLHGQRLGQAEDVLGGGGRVGHECVAHARPRDCQARGGRVRGGAAEPAAARAARAVVGRLALAQVRVQALPAGPVSTFASTGAACGQGAGGKDKPERMVQATRKRTHILDHTCILSSRARRLPHLHD
jgi:hypothetical protein